MQAHGVPEVLRSGDVHVPSYAFPEAAAIALARVTRYGEWRARPAALDAHIDDVRRDEAAAIVAAALGRGPGWLTPNETAALLSCYGLPALDQEVVSTPEEAAKAAARIGGAVALKAIAPGLVHKTEADAVRLKLMPDDVQSAARDMAQRLRSVGHAPDGFLVQRMAAAGVEMIVGVVHDRQFGPVVACGAGGILVELLKDVSVRLAPLSRQDAEEMVRELKTYPLLTGYRGGPKYDELALVDAILRLGVMVEDLPQIAELDLNPILVHTRGATIVDARVRIAPAEVAPPLGARR
jgi:acyl-CoA synthetase (NDP forming)